MKRKLFDFTYIKYSFEIFVFLFFLNYSYQVIFRILCISIFFLNFVYFSYEIKVVISP